MKILCDKFSELRKHSLQLFYAIRDHPNTMLYNDEDLEVMFVVADSIGLNCIKVTVVDSRGFDSGTSGCGGDVGANSSGVFESGGGDVGGSTSKGHFFQMVFKSKKRPVNVVDDLKEYYGVDVSYNRVWLAVQKAKSSAFGDYSDSFNQLQWYRNVVLNLDPKTVFDVEWDETTNHFLRLFVAFDACVQGFKHCRPVLSVDAMFLKASHMGCLMSASATDSNAGQRYGAMSSSLTECFNSWILKERELPMVDMVDRIRKKMMKSMCLRSEKASKWEQAIHFSFERSHMLLNDLLHRILHR
ncbi:hypothetical protein RHMOL_Rhmol11G0069100 [Rhododendron molle]|uniref:Uncharacterized protein n=1 Tax=Rhododendron molle TaxID=49168 RepID=A0ACC0LR21_RHOML|nr:hypothetical protein RHMOL_Rhmol11G0069100 [Rhododendron molle]